MGAQPPAQVSCIALQRLRGLHSIGVHYTVCSGFLSASRLVECSSLRSMLAVVLLAVSHARKSSE